MSTIRDLINSAKQMLAKAAAHFDAVMTLHAQATPALTAGSRHAWFQTGTVGSSGFLGSCT